MRVHSALGPGLLEAAYESCMCHELSKTALPFERQKAIPVVYEDMPLACGFRADLIIASRLIVEIKAVDRLGPIHESQLLTYLRLTGLRVGLLINFNVRHLRDGIRRRVN